MIPEILPALTPKERARMNVVLLDDRNQMRLLPAHEIRQFTPQALRVWATMNSRYNLPTVELVAWLRGEIGVRTAIEIGAGMGDLGNLLGIPMTDSYQQVDDPETAAIMALCNQPPTRPPREVLKMDATEAVTSFMPDVTIASWLTQRYLPGETRGNAKGPLEEIIVGNTAVYIHIGNEDIHGDKRILAMKHETYHFDWLVSRARNQSKNVIYVWRNLTWGKMLGFN
jgi:hypothetical protein